MKACWFRMVLASCTALAAMGGIVQSAQAQWGGSSIDVGTSAHQLVQPDQDAYGDALNLYGNSVDLGINYDETVGGGVLIGGGLGVQALSYGWKKTMQSDGIDAQGRRYNETQTSSIFVRPTATATARVGYALNDHLALVAEGGFAAMLFRTGVSTTTATKELPPSTTTTITKTRTSQDPLALGALWEAKAVYAPFGSEATRLVLGAGDARYAVSGAAGSFVFSTKSHADDLRIFWDIEMQL